MGGHQTMKVGNYFFTPLALVVTHKQKNECMRSEWHCGAKNSVCSVRLGSHYVCCHLALLLPTMLYCAVITNTPRTIAGDDKGWRWRGGWAHVVPQSEGMAQQALQCPLDAGWFFDVGNSDWAWFLMLCNFEDGVFEVMHELDSFPASSWFVFVFFVCLFFTISLFSQRFFFFLPMRGTSYVFEVKECFKGICRSTHCGRGLCCAQALIMSLK